MNMQSRRREPRYRHGASHSMMRQATMLAYNNSWMLLLVAFIADRARHSADPQSPAPAAAPVDAH